MAKHCGKTLTQLFVTSAWSLHERLNNAAYDEFVDNGWEESRNGKTLFRCLSKFDADMDTVRRAAKKNPGMIFVAFTVSHETDDTVVHLGIGGAWLKTTRQLSEAIGLRHGLFNWDYVRTMAAQKRRRPSRTPKSGGRIRGVTATKPAYPRKPQKASKVATAVRVHNRLVFHGLPAEVERCRAIVLAMLPEATRAEAKYETAGSEQYLSGTMAITTDNEPAFNVFNRLVAQVPAVTVVLEYDDVKTGQNRQLRAVDGRIVEHRAV